MRFVCERNLRNSLMRFFVDDKQKSRAFSQKKKIQNDSFSQTNSHESLLKVIGKFVKSVGKSSNSPPNLLPFFRGNSSNPE